MLHAVSSFRAPGEGPGEGRGRPLPPEGAGPRSPPPHEPAIKAPWPPLLIALGLVALFAAQALSGGQDATIDRFGFRASSLSAGGWTGLLTAPWVHAGWSHAILNALAALAFGTPVARRFGKGAMRSAAFLVFYVMCGVIGSLGFALFHLHDASVLVGASGAIAGLMGASSRLIPPFGRAGLAPFTSPTVLAMAGSWLALNLVFALIGLNLGGSNAPLAWEAHLFGYAAGLFLIGPAARLLDEAD